MSYAITMELNPKGPKHKALTDKLFQRYRISRDKMSNKHTGYQLAEDRFVAYMPEREVDAKRKLLREGGKPQFTTIVIPYSYALLMTAHTYWTTVFLSRSPVFQYQARHGEIRSNEQAVESLIDYQLNVGEWLVPLYIWLLDVGKYGDATIGAYWCDEKTQVSEIVEQEEMFLGMIPTGKTVKKKQTKTVQGFAGNRLFNVRPQHFFPDTRRPIHRFQEGEFAARYVEMSMNELRKGEQEGRYVNIDELVKVNPGADYMNQFGSVGVEQPNPQDSFYSSGERGNLDYKGMVEIYIELIPNEWELGSGKFPEKWVFLCDAKFQVCCMARPLGALHNMYQFANMQLEPDGYSLSSRGMMEILEPLQATMDWLINTHFYNIRKALNDQFVVDPSRVVMKDVLDPLPGGIIRMKPGAYGQDARTMISQLGVQDVTQMHLADSDRIAQLMQRVSSVSDQVMGMMQGSGRKTAQEVRTSSAFSANRLKTQAEYFSAMGWSKLSRIVLSNTQQYYDQERQYKIAGDLLQVGGPQSRLITPDDIAGFYDFVAVDGTMPVDRFAQANLWRELYGQMAQDPMLMQQFDRAGIFAWISQLAGLKNLNQFRIQIMPDQQAAAMAGAGNLVSPQEYGNVTGGAGSIGGPAGDAAERFGSVSEPGQLTGMGPTG